MIRPEFRETLETQHKVLVTLWLLFLCALPLYLWIARFLFAGPGSAADDALSQTLRSVLWVLAFVDLGYLLWWKRRFLGREAILGGARRFKLLQALQGHENPLEESAAEIVSSYVTGKVVAFAIAEALAVYGFVLAFVGHYFSDQVLFSLASGLLLAVEFPSRSFLQQLLRDIELRGG